MTELKHKKSTQGFALATTLFVLVGLTAALTLGFLGSTRSHYQAARFLESARVQWVAAGMLEVAISEFEAEKKSAGDDFLSMSDEDFGDVKARVEANVLQEVRLTWPEPSSGVGSAAVRYKKKVEITREQRDGGYYYIIKTFVRDLITGANAKLSQTVRWYIGSVFDFGVFFEDDLEIVPGADMKIQGPIFSNGNIYLMAPVAGSVAEPLKLSIRTPDDYPDSFNGADYAIKAHGQIYFYFKPLLGRNYMRDDPLGRYSTYAGTAYNPSDSVAEFMWSALPHIYYAKNQIHNLTGWVREACQQDLDGDTNFESDCGHHIELVDGAAAPAGLKFPSSVYTEIYYRGLFSTYFDKGKYLSGGGWGNSATLYMNFSGAYEVEAASSKPLLPKTFSEEFAEFNGYPNDAWSSGKNSLGSYFGRRIIDDSVSRIDLKLGNFDPATTPNRIVIQSINQSFYPTDPEAVDLSNVGPGAPDFPGSFDPADPRMAVKADIIFFCKKIGTSSCAEIYARINRDIGDQLVTSLGDYGVSANACFDDRRQKARVRVFRADLDQLIEQLVGRDLINSDSSKKLTVYFDTVPFSLEPMTTDETQGYNSGSYNQSFSACSTGPVRMVEIYNGKNIPGGGMTVATNGRLWVQLDGEDQAGVQVHEHLNALQLGSPRLPCTYSGESGGPSSGPGVWPDCDLPPMALISDSIGVETHEKDVSENHILNAGVVAGYVPSQLKRLYYNCDATLGQLANCDPSPQASFPSDVHVWFHQQDGTTVPWAHSYNGAWCPGGLNSDSGSPITPSGCNIYFNTTEGIFYYRRPFFVKKIYEQFKADYERYLQAFTNWSAQPAGTVYKNLAGYMSNPPVLGASWTDLDALVLSALGSNEVDAASGFDSSLISSIKSGIGNAHFAADGTFKLRLPTTDAHNEPSPIAPRFPGMVEEFLAYQVTATGGIDFPAGTKNIQYLWVPVGVDGKLKDPTSLANDLTVTSYDPTASYNFVHGGKFYKFYWREMITNFGMVPEWPIPAQATQFLQNRSCDTCNWPPVKQGSAYNNIKRIGSQAVGVKVYVNPTYSYNQELVGSNKRFRPQASLPLPGLYKQTIEVPAQQLRSGVGKGAQTCAPSTPGNHGCEGVGCEPSWGGGGACTLNPGEHAGATFRDSSREYEYTPDHYALHSDHLNLNSQPGQGLSWYYHHGRYVPLYEPKFSGGIENIVNYQNLWGPQNARKKIYILGSMVAPWHSTELLDSNGNPAFFDLQSYSVPARYFDYDENLAVRRPPESPGARSYDRINYTEEYVQAGELP